MHKRLKSSFARLCLGGSLLGLSPLLLAHTSCPYLTNAALEAYVAGVGSSAVQVAGEQLPVGPNTDRIFVDPLADLVSSIWTTYVDVRVADDPTYEPLVVR
jgi:hypothetical protein